MYTDRHAKTSSVLLKLQNYCATRMKMVSGENVWLNRIAYIGRPLRWTDMLNTTEVKGRRVTASVGIRYPEFSDEHVRYTADDGDEVEHVPRVAKVVLQTVRQLRSGDFTNGSLASKVH